MNNKKSVLVIGTGFGGLSASALLAKSGLFDVTVLEKNESFGGRASVWRKEGFTFDMGPSWYLMPDIFEKFFSHFNVKPTDLYDLVQLDPSYKIFFEGNKEVEIKANLDENLSLFDTLEEYGSKKLEKYLKKSKFQYETVTEEFLYRDYNTIFDFMKPGVAKTGMRLGNPFTSLDKTVSKTFSSDEAKKILEYSIVFLGGNPSNTPGLYSLMSHIDFNLGVWYPLGGIGKVTQAIHDLAVQNGANFHFNQEVKRIDVQNKKATNVITQDDAFSADIIVINADYHHAETTFFFKAKPILS